ncbi:hypothetical protein SUGI_0067500 [Cryptomeria japonica]|nr:hypothetical protein SUGI_0067500 [Cryptomeria japonica]
MAWLEFMDVCSLWRKQSQKQVLCVLKGSILKIWLVRYVVLMQTTTYAGSGCLKLLLSKIPCVVIIFIHCWWENSHGF